MADLTALVEKLDRIASVTLGAAAQAAASGIVQDLRDSGPWWSGEFASNWEINLDSPVAATLAPADDSPWGYQDLEDIAAKKTPRRQLPPLTPPSISGLQEGETRYYFIGNRMIYRDIALDLVPGRLKGGRGGTAPQDWYETYVVGGGLDQSIRLAVNPVLRAEGFR